MSGMWKSLKSCEKGVVGQKGAEGQGHSWASEASVVSGLRKKSRVTGPKARSVNAHAGRVRYLGTCQKRSWHSLLLRSFILETE